MRIGVNCLQVDPHYVGGVNTYTFGLLRGFAATSAGHSFQIYVAPRNASMFDEFTRLPNFRVIVCSEMASFGRRALRRLAQDTGWIWLYEASVTALFRGTARVIEESSDFLYTPTTVLFPFRLRLPQLLSMHDIQHEHYPEFFSAKERRWRRINFLLSARRADGFQASSQFIQKDLLEHFPFLRKEQIAVIPEGVTIDEFASPGISARELHEKYGLPERFLFYPAQLWKHKNHITVLKALKLLEETRGLSIPLVLSGARMSGAGEIDKYLADNKLGFVKHLGKVPFRDLVSLYQTARFTITAALYESSSLCLLEAAAAGSALIASATPPNVEMAATLQVSLFPPLDEKALAETLATIWNDDTARDAQVAQNREAVRGYAWTHIASKYLNWIGALPRA